MLKLVSLSLIDVYMYECVQMASSAPGIEESVHSLLSLLDQDKHAKVCLVAHSLGCSFVSWVLHHPIACTRVSATVLIDPVVFLLCDPTVATTVVYKEHANTLDFLMHFFVARELFIANALSRHFNWSHNILFVEDLSAVDSKDVNAYSPCVSGKSAITASGDPSFTDSDSGCSDDSVDAPVQQLQNRHTVSKTFTSVCLSLFFVQAINVVLIFDVMWLDRAVVVRLHRPRSICTEVPAGQDQARSLMLRGKSVKISITVHSSIRFMY